MMAEENVAKKSKFSVKKPKFKIRKVKPSKIYFEKDDFRQIGIVAKNETIKSVRGKRFLVSTIVIVLVWALITLVPFITGKGWESYTLGEMLSSYLSYASMFVVLVVGLVGSVALVSEYEERTALILFTRPIKKTTIFIGKFVSAFILSCLLMLLYYIGVDIMTLWFHGCIPGDLVASFGMCCCYVFAATGISFVFSAFLKRSSIAIIFSILALIVVIPIVTMMIKGDTWYMLDTASATILTCVPEYVTSYNQGVADMYEAMYRIYDAMITSSDQKVREVYAPAMLQIMEMMKAFIAPISTPDLWKNAAVMLTWGLVASVISWIAFLRREF